MKGENGTEGDAYPVRSGEVWSCGRHVYLCSDLMAEPSLLRRLLSTIAAPGRPDRPTLVYTDPPWGQGLAKAFRTKAGLSEPIAYDWTDVYRECAALAELLEVPIWAECSAADTRIGMSVPATLTREAGGTKRGYWPITYFGGNRAGLYYAGAVPPPDLTLEGADAAGFRPCALALTSYPTGVVLDPCGGLGGIPLTAQRVGWASVSNELSPRRMSTALARMNKTTGETPRRLQQW